jgi:hypothetical protein
MGRKTACLAQASACREKRRPIPQTAITGSTKRLYGSSAPSPLRVALRLPTKAETSTRCRKIGPFAPTDGLLPNTGMTPRACLIYRESPAGARGRIPICVTSCGQRIQRPDRAVLFSR